MKSENQKFYLASHGVVDGRCLIDADADTTRQKSTNGPENRNDGDRIQKDAFLAKVQQNKYFQFDCVTKFSFRLLPEQKVY